jgi:hypothetical protein
LERFASAIPNLDSFALRYPGMPGLAANSTGASVRRKYSA